MKEAEGTRWIEEMDDDVHAGCINQDNKM